MAEEKIKPMTEAQVRDYIVQNCVGLKQLALVINGGKPAVMIGAPDSGDGIFVVTVERSSSAALQTILNAQNKEEPQVG